MNKEIKLTVIIVVFTAILLLGIVYVYTSIEIKRLDDEIIKSKINKVSLVSSRFELRIQYLTGIMEMTSRMPVIHAPPIHANLISDQLKGIPENADVEKRMIAKDMLDVPFDLDYVFYAMPNGDIYFLEPFYSQLQLSQLNFAFRDWYKGAINTGNTYVSEVYVSANTKYNVIAVAVPLYGDGANKSLNGIWVGTLNLSTLQNNLSELYPGSNEYLLIADQNNNIVADTRKTESGTMIQQIPWDLKEESNGETKTIVKEIDGKKIFITYKSLPVGSHEWVVMSIQPYADTFASSIALTQETIIIILTIITIMGTSGFFMIRKANANIILSTNLEKTILELNLLTEQLRQTDITKEEFSAMITHELKTPIVPIIGYCKMLKTDMLGKLNDEQLSAIRVIEKSTKKLEKLVSDIMDARKLDLDKMKFNIEDVALDDFFNNLSLNYTQVLHEEGKTFSVDQPVSGMSIKTDKSRLAQVFDNLISNAIKFTPEKNGKIVIGSKKSDGKVVFYVKDNGIGIPPESQSGLFKKFYQVDTSERRKAGGTGLGLAICKGIVTKLGGRIWVESDGKTGTSFYFEFPL